MGGGGLYFIGDIFNCWLYYESQSVIIAMFKQQPDKKL